MDNTFKEYLMFQIFHNYLKLLRCITEIKRKTFQGAINNFLGPEKCFKLIVTKVQGTTLVTMF